MYTEQIFNLAPEQVEKAHSLIDEMNEKNLSVIVFENGPINVFLVKDGTQEAQDRKDQTLTLGVLEYNGEQYLVTMK